jgi:hypothetical protein
MTVMVDIPGVGVVEARNAATEATLRELLAVMRGSAGGGRGGAAGGGGGAAGGGGGAAGGLNPLTRATGLLTRGFTGLVSSVRTVAGGMVALGEAATKTIEQFANVGDSVENAASVFSKVPLLGTMFSAVATAATKTTDAFQKVTASGATFGGSVSQMAASASAAGMTLDQFAGIISRNGESMRLLGGDTESGAKRFAQISKTLRTTSGDLYNLGFTTEDVNQGLANYTKYLGQTGKLGNKTNAELAAGSAKYLKEMDLLAKITGETRKEQEDARAKLLNDAQYQAKVASMGAEAGESFANTVNMLPAGLRDVAKDIMTTGTATTEESQKFMALMPKSASLMQEYAQITENGGTITAEMQNRLNNMLAEEGKAQKAQFRAQGIYNKEMAGAYMNTVQASNIQNDAVKKSAEAQKNAQKSTDGQAAAMERTKQALAEFSNSFQMALANSGILNTLMTMFGVAANIVQKVLVPVFKFFADAITRAVKFIGEVFSGKSVKESFGKVMDTAKKLLTNIGDFFNSIWKAIDWNKIKEVATTTLVTVFDTFTFLMEKITPVALKIFEVGQGLFDKLMPIFTDIGDIIKRIAEVVMPLIPPIADAIGSVLGSFFDVLGGFVRAVKKLITGDFWGAIGEFGSIFKSFVEGIGNMLVVLKEIVSGGIKALWNFLTGKTPEKPPEEDKKAAEAAKVKQQQDLKTAEAAKNKENTEKKAAEAAKKKEDSEKKAAEAAKKKEEDAKRAATATPAVVKNYNDPMALLGAELKQQKSTILPNAETAKKEIEAQAQKKAEAQTSSGGSGTTSGTISTGTSRPAGSAAVSQESAESLLSSLNSKMEQLVKLNREMYSINERQLSVQQGLSGDLFASV